MGPTVSTLTLGCSDPEEEQDSSQAPEENIEIERTVWNCESTTPPSSTTSTPTSPAAVSISSESITGPSTDPSPAVNTDPTEEPSSSSTQSIPVTSSSIVSHSVESDLFELTVSTSDGLPHNQHPEEKSTTLTQQVPSSISDIEPSISAPSHLPLTGITLTAVKTSVTPSSFLSTQPEVIPSPTTLTGSLESLTTSSSSTVVLCGGSVTASTTIVTTSVDSVTPTTSPSSSSVVYSSPVSTCSLSANNMEEVSAVQDVENGVVEDQNSSNPMEEVDDVDMQASKPLVAPSNTPITGDSGHNSPIMERSSSSDDGLKEKVKDNKTPEKKEEKIEEKPKPDQAPASANPVKESSRNGSKESKKDKTSGKSKKKEDKGIEYILRALNSLQTPEEKLAALCKRYADMHEEHRVLQTSFKTQQRSMTMLMREKDQIQSDHAKAVIAKSKLESLCRELQKQNKLIKDESIQRAKEDDEKRREISAKFQTTIGEIQTQMNNNNERNSKLQKENLELAGQLKKFVEQYENREQKMKQHRDLEQQVAEARLTQAKALLKEEQEKNGKEKELLLMKAAESGKKVGLLEAQVAMFKERYDEFESLHARSNETFQKYKTEMDKMTKRIKRLEKDGMAWKSKWEKANKALIESLEARTASEKETAVYVQKTKKLESLCRALQAELHKDKKPAEAASSNTSPVDEVPPNSPETSSASGQVSPDTTTVLPDNAETPSLSTPTNPTDKDVSSREADENPTSQSPDSTTQQDSSQAVDSSCSSPAIQQQSGEAESENVPPASSSFNSTPVAEVCES